jgi:hypothetical protein
MQARCDRPQSTPPTIGSQSARKNGVREVVVQDGQSVHRMDLQWASVFSRAAAFLEGPLVERCCLDGVRSEKGRTPRAIHRPPVVQRVVQGVVQEIAGSQRLPESNCRVLHIPGAVGSRRLRHCYPTLNPILNSIRRTAQEIQSLKQYSASCRRLQSRESLRNPWKKPNGFVPYRSGCLLTAPAEQQLLANRTFGARHGVERAGGLHDHNQS